MVISEEQNKVEFPVLYQNGNPIKENKEVSSGRIGLVVNKNGLQPGNCGDRHKWQKTVRGDEWTYFVL